MSIEERGGKPFTDHLIITPKWPAWPTPHFVPTNRLKEPLPHPGLITIKPRRFSRVIDGLLATSMKAAAFYYGFAQLAQGPLDESNNPPPTPTNPEPPHAA